MDTFYTEGISHSFRSTIQVIPRTDVEIISFLDGKLKILPEFIKEDIIKGNARLLRDGNIDYFIPIKLEVKTQNMSKDILKGLAYLDRSKYNEKILSGKAKFNSNEFTSDIITGNITSEGSYSNNIITGNLTFDKKLSSKEIYGTTHLEADDYSRVLLHGNMNIKTNKQYWTLLECNDIHIDTVNYQEDILQGNIDFQMGEIIRDIYGKTTLEESGFINDSIIDGNASILKENEEIDLLQGIATVYSHYSAAEFPCRVKVNKKQFIHSIFCKLTVPPNRKYDIPCKIQVEGMNKSETILLEGNITLLDRDQYSQNILSDNHVIYLPGATVDIDCTAKVNPVYTRKELLYCKINVVNTAEFNIPCKVEVEPPADYWFYQEILYSKLIVGTPYEHNIESKVEVKANESGNINTYEYRKYGPRPQSRIVIAVSPTWNYEPFVFKSSLITFLDRYYGKADFSIVFGGSARADFDIMNLAANYKIRRERLLRVPIIVDFKNPMVTANSVDHFIYHMFNFKPEEPKIISRVFLFMNQPSWYYNDPLAKIAEVCIKNQISCVAINGGGEYQEMTKIDRARDEMYNNIEYDRQQRMHPNYGFINVQYKEDPNKITY